MRTKYINVYVSQADGAIKLHIVEMQELPNTNPLRAFANKVYFVTREPVETLVDDIIAGKYDELLLNHDDFAQAEDPQQREFMQLMRAMLVYLNDFYPDVDQRRAELSKIFLSLLYFRKSLTSHIYESYAGFHNYSVGYLSEQNVLGMDDFNIIGIADTIHPFHHYAYLNTTFTLPLENDELYQFIACLDQAMHVAKQDGKKHNFEVNVGYCDTIPNFSNKKEILQASIHELRQSNDEYLSRFVASKIIALAKSDLEDSAYDSAAEQLIYMVTQTEHLSLTVPLLNTTYEASHRLHRLASLTEDEPEMYEILSPAIPYQQSTQTLMKWLRTKLATMDRAKPNYRSSSEENSPGDIRADINIWFTLFDITRKQFWHQFFHELYGQRTRDDGFYHAETPIIRVLYNAKMSLTPEGRLSLDIFDSPAYQSHYAPGKELHDEFAADLNMLCIDIGFSLLSNQNVHKEILFSDNSTSQLMNMGFHITEDYCKSLMRASHHYRLFEGNDSFYQNARSSVVRIKEPDLSGNESNLASKIPLIMGSKGP